MKNEFSVTIVQLKIRGENEQRWLHHFMMSWQQSVHSATHDDSHAPKFSAIVLLSCSDVCVHLMQ